MNHKFAGRRQSDFELTFRGLAAVLGRYRSDLECTVDSATELCLYTRHIMANKKPLCFGAVQIRKRNVSFHLMPVYTNPELLEVISLPLRKRMQGKSCFNLTRNDPQLVSELAELSQRGFNLYRERGYIDA